MRWRDIIHGGDPYKGFPADRYLKFMQGWGSDSPVFEAIIKEKRPEKIIEVGTWFGASAITMADALVKHDIDGEIICVDTWLGTAENWTVWLRPVGNFGHPLHYFQFLTNIIHSGHTERIIPFSIDSHNAALFFRNKDMIADMIYIDASHDYKSVLSDISEYWLLTRHGGVILGDDYSDDFPEVKIAVQEFAHGHGVSIITDHPGKWVIYRP